MKLRKYADEKIIFCVLGIRVNTGEIIGFPSIQFETFDSLEDALDASKTKENKKIFKKAKKEDKNAELIICMDQIEESNKKAIRETDDVDCILHYCLNALFTFDIDYEVKDIMLEPRRNKDKNIGNIYIEFNDDKSYKISTCHGDSSVYFADICKDKKISKLIYDIKY